MGKRRSRSLDSGSGSAEGRKVQLRLDGVPFAPAGFDYTERLKRYLETLPDNEVKSTAVAFEAAAIKRGSMCEARASLADYSLKVGRGRGGRVVWGNPRAIRELKRQLETAEQEA